MDELDGRILAVLQDDFPLERRPYRNLAGRLGLSEEETFERVRRLVERVVIRRLGPRYNTRRFGRKSALVAACVPGDRIELVAGKLAPYHQVTHCYERSGSRYNLWFTLTADENESPEELLEVLRGRTGEGDMHGLPATKVYKLRVRFPLGPRESAPAVTPPRPGVAPVIPDENDRRLIAATQSGLPVCIDPFEELANRLGLPVEEVLGRLSSMRENGLIRSLGAILDGPALGYRGNILAAWRVGHEQADRAGKIFAGNDSVSHCYLRPPLADFAYSLYTMVHGRDAEDCRDVIRRMSVEAGVAEHVELPTVHEFKKTAVQLF